MDDWAGAFVLIFLCCVFFLLLAALAAWLASINHWWPFGGRKRYAEREFFARDQIVLSGPRASVETALAQVRGVSLRLLERLEFETLGLPPDCPVPPDFVAGLYRIEGWFPNVRRAIETLHNTPAGRAGDISAEPNWVTGHPWEPEGSPWEPEGSPWEPEGSPWEPEGSSTPQKPRRRRENDAQAAWFMQQWAWQAISLEARTKQATGRNVAVGVFDTSPFALPIGTRDQPQPVPGVHEPAPLTLLVSHPRFALPPTPPKHPLPDVRNHGVFVAGLIHALAPQAEIHLVRVLNSQNRGDLFTLLREVFLFLKAHAGGSQGLVLNLSLGIRVPPPEAGFQLPAEVRVLYHLTQAARCLNAVVVAAAGNESGPQSALPANLPAQWEHVIGVAASNIHNQRACFSNRGDLAAPGGDGARQAIRLAMRTTTEQCAPAIAACDGPQCPYGLIGPTLEEAPHSGFIFWTGSSFAAPLVSGLAALIVQVGAGKYTPAEVEALLYCGATPTDDPALGAGVINVGRSLRECRRTRGSKST
ncbi:MAG: hypothetical protein Fur0018_04030 [Anaerolineales bacterium]